MVGFFRRKYLSLINRTGFKELKGFSSLRAVFITGFVTGIISVSFVFYYQFIFSAPGEDIVKLEIPSDHESVYLKQYQVQVSALVGEFIGIRRRITENGNHYLVIYGNTPSGCVVLTEDFQNNLIYEQENMPGDGVIIELINPEKTTIINVKY